MGARKPHVWILTTGGTIASRRQGGMAKGSEVVSTVPEIADIAKITQEEFCVVASSQMTPEMMFKLAKRAGEVLEQDDVDGVVITHGTDTMEETVYMLDLVVPGEKPVVITGAMRIAEDLGADGTRNIYAAVAVAASEEAKNRGAMLVLNDEIHHAKYVQKVHSSNPAAFGSPGKGRMGEVHGSKPVFYWPQEPRTPVNATELVQPVDLFKVYAGMDDRLIKASINSGAKAIVLEVMGKGNIPKTILPGLEACKQAGIPVVMVTRCAAGQVDIQRYEEAYGVVNGGEIAGVKVRICLGVLDKPCAS